MADFVFVWVQYMPCHILCFSAPAVWVKIKHGSVSSDVLPHARATSLGTLVKHLYIKGMKGLCLDSGGWRGWRPKREKIWEHLKTFVRPDLLYARWFSWSQSQSWIHHRFINLLICLQWLCKHTFCLPMMHLPSSFSCPCVFHSMCSYVVTFFFCHLRACVWECLCTYSVCK